MKRLAIIDSLTGLYNRHLFNEMLKREVDRAARFATPLTLLLIDVDDFKFFNDNYGHLQGDRMLVLAAGALTGQLRSVDILARFGGDEFAVILPETSLEGGQAVAERMKKTVAALSFASKPLGVSIGSSGYALGQTPEQLVDEADRALYADKASKLHDWRTQNE